MITPSKRWDWFSVPFEEAKHLATVPGVHYKNGVFNIHRTHLTLLGDAGRDALAATMPSDDVVDPDGVTLRPWQRTAIEWIKPRKGVLLTDEQRLGKTGSALCCHDPASGPLVVVAPLDTRPVWFRWFAKIWPGVEAVAVTGRTLDPASVVGHPIVFIHYDILMHQQITSLQPGTLILDEVHLLSNPKSRRTQSVLFYASFAKRVIALSGTPLWNQTKGLWPLLAAAAPGAWGSAFEFGQHYSSPTLTEHGWHYGSLSNADEWFARCSEIVLGRTWAEVMPELPPIERTVVEIPLDADAAFAVDVAAVELRKVAARDLDITTLNRYRQAVGRFKINPAVAEARAILDRGAPVLLWTWHKAIAKAIASKLEGAFLMTGDDDGNRRAAVIEAWWAAPAAPLVATLSTGQVGIDLSHTEDEIVVEIDWTPAVLSQAEMRPFSAVHPTRAKYLVLKHEADLMLMDAVLKKLARGRATGLPAAGSSFEEIVECEKLDEGDLLRELGALLLQTR